MEQTHNTEVLDAILNIPAGYSTGMYNGARYGITRTAFNKGRSQKVYSKELGGNAHFSLNHYRTARGSLLRPCEMPEAKVVDFLRNVELDPLTVQAPNISLA